MKSALASINRCWNWKCALLSATARSVVYLLAMARHSDQNPLAVVLVEVVYVTLTAGLWAGLQQRALGFKRRRLGDLVVVLLVPGLAQLCDALAHALSRTTAPPRAMVAVCAFTLLSALFHLHVMRRGAFLSGKGCSLIEDFRRMPRLAAGFALQPLATVFAPMQRLIRSVEHSVRLNRSLWSTPGRAD